MSTCWWSTLPPLANRVPRQLSMPAGGLVDGSAVSHFRREGRRYENGCFLLQNKLGRFHDRPLNRREAKLLAQRAAAAAALSIVLMGCQTEPSSSGNAPVVARPAGNAPAPPGSVAFRCPVAGTVVHLNTGGRLEYRGADPSDPTVCLATNASGQQQRRLYNFFSLPLTDERSVRQGLQSLWPMAVGGTANYVFIGRTDRGETFQYTESWRVLRAEPLTIGGVVRNTLVVQRTQEGRMDNRFLGTDTHWWDTATGAWVKGEVSVTRGNTSSRPYQATSITRPST